MYVDSMENLSVTVDPQRVRPGMIYVDLSRRRNRRQIYEAYVNGATLIFTPHNISDPDLPVVKVKSPQDTICMLFDSFLSKQEHHAKLIGVLGDSDRSVLVELIQRILYGRNDNGIMNSWSRINKRNQHSIENFFSSFIDMYKAGMDIIPIAIDANASDLLYFGNINLDCTILTDRGFWESSYGNQSAFDFFSRLAEEKTIIINNDENDILKAEDGRKIKSITYGLNKKAAVTASSIFVDDATCFNYCVQKSFQIESGGRIEPFEIPIRLNALGNHNIYNALAAITCGLYYGADITSIKASVESYTTPARHFQRIYDGDYAIIDNYCSSIHDYTEAFESMQILSYGDLMLIISVTQDSNLSFHWEKAMVIADWAKILNCKEVILTSCMDNNSHIGELPIKTMRIYKKIFKENEIPFRYYHLLQHALEKGLAGLKKRDLMVIMGSDEMNIAHRILHRYLNSLSDKKN